MDVGGDFLGPPHCTTTRTLLIKVIEKHEQELDQSKGKSRSLKTKAGNRKILQIDKIQ